MRQLADRFQAGAVVMISEPPTLFGVANTQRGRDQQSAAGVSAVGLARRTIRDLAGRTKSEYASIRTVTREACPGLAGPRAR